MKYTFYRLGFLLMCLMFNSHQLVFEDLKAALEEARTVRIINYKPSRLFLFLSISGLE